MHLPETCIRFGLLLEAYCRGCGNHLRELSAQVNAMGEFVRIADSVKPKALNKQAKVKLAQDSLAQLQVCEEACFSFLFVSLFLHLFSCFVSFSQGLDWCLCASAGPYLPRQVCRVRACHGLEETATLAQVHGLFVLLRRLFPLTSPPE
jgi:hypothetical protein